MTNIEVVVGTQYGSEGKGAIAAHITRRLSWQNDRSLAIRVAGPNAGHTAYDDQGREWKLRSIPVAAVVNPHCHLHIAAGSEIDLGVTMDEIAALEMAGIAVVGRLTVHPSATVIQRRHLDQEQMAGLVQRVGSTGKGIGAARADRIMRKAMTFDQITQEMDKEGQQFWREGLWYARTAPKESASSGIALTVWDSYDRILVEGTQGYGLGLHTRFYPQVTSSDCRAVDFLAMAGVSPWHTRANVHVHLVTRVYPIRVAGNSGPMKDETTWHNLGLPPERTTVTNKVRRVGEWDEELVAEAILANGGGDFNPQVTMALTMLDQLRPEVTGATDYDKLSVEAKLHIEKLEAQMGTHINLVGTGPQTVVER